jgi:hypothetical protein
MDLTKTIAYRAFSTPQQLHDMIAELLANAQANGVDPRTVNLDMEATVARLVEVTLADGSKVCNIEIGTE